MKVLVTGGTGTVGGYLLRDLRRRHASARVLTRKNPAPGSFPADVEIAIGDMLDPASMRRALEGVDELFLLNAVSPDELTQALIAIGAAKQAGVRHVTYLSVLQAERFPDVPHFAAKLAAEAALRDSGVACTVLRPGYFFQNEVWVKDAITRGGTYPMPLGTAGVAGVDARDIAEAAAVSLTTEGHDGRTYNLVSAGPLSGPGNAAVWRELISREVHYGGHDFDAFEGHLLTYLPPWNAFDIRRMFQGFFERGLPLVTDDVSRLTELLGHAPRTYREFAREQAEAWRKT